MLDESYIQITLELAKKGKGNVSPFPLIGSIVVKNDKIIGAGYLCSADSESPEITAIKNAKENVEGASLYCNLEPCGLIEMNQNCIDFIIQSKVKKIILGMAHPHPVLGGSAIKKFKRAGIEVVTNVLESECRDLNKFYIKYILTKLPFVSLKMATTIDGKIADSSGDSKWISSVESRSFVHSLRSEFDAVLVGYNTVKIDNPELTVRLVEGRNPKRIILDSDLKIDTSFKVLKNNIDHNLIILTSGESKAKKKKLERLDGYGAEIIFVERKKNGTLNLKKALSELASKNISSILVEGGAKVFSSFIKEKLFDEALLFLSPKLLGKGLSCVENLSINKISKAVKLRIKSMDSMGDDAFIRMVRN